MKRIQGPESTETETARPDTTVPKRTWQSETERIRKGYRIRLLPRAHEGIRAAAKREGITIADFVERIGLALPIE